jgi:uncharacterized protein YegL
LRGFQFFAPTEKVDEPPATHHTTPPKSKMLSAFRNATHLAVQIHIHKSAAPSPTKPIHLALLLDVSGSMNGERIITVKRTLHAIKPLLRAEDTVTLVTYSSGATCVTNYLEMVPPNVAHLFDQIDRLKCEGGTNLGAGLGELLRIQRPTKPFSALLLLTDGNVNLGATNTSELRYMADALRVPVTALGYGDDHNRTLLRDIALNSRGAYNIIDSETREMLPQILGELMGGLSVAVCEEAVVSVPQGWACIERRTTGDRGLSSHYLGRLIPDRDYWVVFERPTQTAEPESTPITLWGDGIATEHLTRVPFTDCHELEEQVLRCKVAAALTRAADAIERREAFKAEVMDLIAKIDLPENEGLRHRPLVAGMRAQLQVIADYRASADLMMARQVTARASAGASCLSTQQGALDPALTFSSAHQRQVSSATQAVFARTV